MELGDAAMLILAFDAAGNGCSACLWRDEGQGLVRRAQETVLGQAEALAPMVRDLMGAAAVGWEALDRIAVTRGPGSFTGLRVGLATARALALAAGIPAVGTTTLECAALQARDDAAFRPTGVLLAAIDARRADVFAQAFDAATGAPASPPQSLDPAALPDAAARWGANGALQLCGSGADLLLANAPGGVALKRVGGARIAPETVARIAAGRAADGAPPSALYIRPPDAAAPKNQGRLRP